MVRCVKGQVSPSSSLPPSHLIDNVNKYSGLLVSNDPATESNNVIFLTF